MFTRFALVALPLLSLAAVPGVASAETASAVVHYDDLNLATDAGVATLNGRVAAAATRLSGTADARDSVELRMIAANRRAAIASAQPQVQSAIDAARTRTQLASADGKTITASF